MLQRILTALVGIPLVILLLFAWNGSVFALGIGLLSVLGAHEFYRAVRQQGRGTPVEWIGLLACAGLIGAAWFGRDDLRFAVLTAAILAGLIAEVFRAQRAPIANLGALLAGILYAGWLFSFVVMLRHQFPEQITVSPLSQGFERGAFLVLFSLFCIWAADTFAFFSGKFLGRHRLCPSLSPGKTIEGAIGGFLGAVVIGGLVGNWFRIPVPHALVMGGIAGVFSIIGDLAESAMKRDLGVKDFGALLPGHGGVLDRFDSTLMVVPLIYGYLLVIMRWTR